MEAQLDTVTQSQPAEETYCGATFANIDEVKRLVSMDVKLTGMLLRGTVTVEQYDSVYSSYECRFGSALELKDMHLKRFTEDLGEYQSRLRKAQEEKDLLEARKEIGDIQGDSYVFKRRAVDWDMAKLQAGVDRNLRCIRAIETLPEQMDQRDVSAIEEFMSNKMAAVKNADIDAETKKKLRANIKRLAQLVGVA
ncbi:hypothetical protein JXL21_04755 [Candidatus Bathyarchaeota archaeon]|nr:hypothetical protein [Candidatus Bathyarchaeota archaeon]